MTLRQCVTDRKRRSHSTCHLTLALHVTEAPINTFKRALISRKKRELNEIEHLMMKLCQRSPLNVTSFSKLFFATINCYASSPPSCFFLSFLLFIMFLLPLPLISDPWPTLNGIHLSSSSELDLPRISTRV